jgi:hypothetical protein
VQAIITASTEDPSKVTNKIRFFIVLPVLIRGTDGPLRFTRKIAWDSICTGSRTESECGSASQPKCAAWWPTSLSEPGWSPVAKAHHCDPDPCHSAEIAPTFDLLAPARSCRSSCQPLLKRYAMPGNIFPGALRDPGWAYCYEKVSLVGNRPVCAPGITQVARPTLGGFAALAVVPGQFLLKDVVLLGASLWSLGEALKG